VRGAAHRTHLPPHWRDLPQRSTGSGFLRLPLQEEENPLNRHFQSQNCCFFFFFRPCEEECYFRNIPAVRCREAAVPEESDPAPDDG